MVQLRGDPAGWGPALARALAPVGEEVACAAAVLVALGPLCYECGSGVFAALWRRRRAGLLWALGRFCQEDYATLLPKLSLLAMNCLSVLCKDPHLAAAAVGAGALLSLLGTALAAPDGDAAPDTGLGGGGGGGGAGAGPAPIATEREVAAKLWGHCRQLAIACLTEEADRTCGLGEDPALLLGEEGGPEAAA
eukprot:CAMPEP_0194576504 /NCGR_PEP_ID=MMETSP0292-20121207/11608_1 /TAXON_ID=39354 /ORGANISM="Heterosigma akashiwo, Strain CCMP2393" /LENGTH=192 /DNA_ID=CAMNT_0039428597 /DNA_START=144 /DNA_END=718 /DNA_ORIENTATION=-